MYAQSAGRSGQTSVSITLPPGAQVINTGGDAQRYVLSEDGRRLMDTAPVFPGGDHLVHVIYALPYEGSTNIQLPLDYTLDGTVQLLVEADRLSVSSEQLTPLGPQTMQGMVFQGYAATLSLAAGEVLSFSVAGSPTGQIAGIPTPNLLAYGLIAIGSLSLLVAAALYYFGRRMPASNQQLREVIIEQIAELDELHTQGKIDPGAYQERRAKLKARLLNKK
jgi:hypothetical protein